MSGTVNNPGTPTNPDGEGKMILDNNASPGCERPHLNCYPFTWKTLAEYWTDAGVSWQVYQEVSSVSLSFLPYFANLRVPCRILRLWEGRPAFLGIKILALKLC